MDWLKDLIGKFISALPFKKLSANQTFDLCCDTVMLFLVVIGLKADLGPNQGTWKPLLAFFALAFVAWSFSENT
jgi:hypothetical protein